MRRGSEKIHRNLDAQDLRKILKLLDENSVARFKL